MNLDNKEYWFIYMSHCGGYYASNKFLGDSVYCEDCRDYDVLMDEGYESDLMYEEDNWREEILLAKKRMVA